jgi:hypothetical protein
VARNNRIRPRSTPRVDIEEIVREQLTKALQLPAGTQTTQITTAYLQQLQQRNSYRPVPGSETLLARDPGNENSFGPGTPLIPSPLDQLLPSGRPAPRRYEYPVSWNLQTTTTRSVPWSVLRDSADQVSIMRACIEVNKAAMTGLEWSFGIDGSRAKRIAKRTGVAKQTVTSDLQDKYSDQIDRLHQWWAKPDRINSWNFSEWLGAILEDQLVIDAVALYPHMQLNGDLHSLELLDATTIKPLLDSRGATPQPPYAAFQQILWGFPRGEFEASPSGEVDAEFTSAIYGNLKGLPGAAKTDALIYKVRNRRSRGPYGFSCVEQALADIDLWLKRFDWLRSEYTAGVAPEMLVGVDSNMTPEQLREYEAVFNDDLSGRNAERHRARFLPAGFTATYPDSHDTKYTSDFDLHLIRLICAAFEVLPTSLGFTPNHGSGAIGGRGLQQGEQDTQLRRGTKPTAAWLTDLINEVSTYYLGMPPEVTFQFHGLDDDDETKEAALLEGYVNNAMYTLNETRDALNLPRYEFPEADEPFLATPTGPAWLNVEVQPVGMPGNLPSAAQNQPGYYSANGPQNGGTQAQPAQPPAQPKPTATVPNGKPAKKPVASAKKAEQRAFTAFMAKRAGTGLWRDFTFEELDAEIGEAANRLAAAGDVDAVKALFELNDGS